MSELLRCQGLVRRFGALAAVDGVDLSITQGARHALIGPNGAGKSTLFRLISGGLPATAGEVFFDGRNVTGLSEQKRARLGIGQTFQHTSVFGSLTVAQNIALGARRRTIDAGALLKEVGLLDVSRITADALSHGQCRQLEVAIALAAGPRLLLLDEPSAGMSPAESALLLQLLRALGAEVTIVFVEHDLDLVFKLATRVTVMHLGRVLMSGTPEQIRESPQVQEAYLGTGKREDLFDAAPGA